MAFPQPAPATTSAQPLDFYFSTPTGNNSRQILQGTATIAMTGYGTSPATAITTTVTTFPIDVGWHYWSGYMLSATAASLVPPLPGLYCDLDGVARNGPVENMDLANAMSLSHPWI